MRVLRCLALATLLVACRGKHHVREDAAPVVQRDATRIDADSAFHELDAITHVEPVRQIALPVKTGVPRFDLGGPVVIGDVAVVASSQFGFLGVDYHAGHVAWTKPAGERIAPPVIVGGSVVLIGECLSTQPVKDTLLGCLRVVTETGADQGYLAIHGSGVDDFAASPGDQNVWQSGEHAVVWRRGDAAVSVDLMTGVATKTTATQPPTGARPSTAPSQRWQSGVTRLR